ncbi:hypothetical protein ACFZCU_46000 [Streptomyces canus]|uniref:hypothetical protein n=1 Tax=Streptomyces canus TaxID=58343 RepID=UPI0036E63955
MTDRKTIDQITSDELDQLYYRLASIRDAAVLHRQGLISNRELYAAVEADPTAEQLARTIPNNPPTSKDK